MSASVRPPQARRRSRVRLWVARQPVWAVAVVGGLIWILLCGVYVAIPRGYYTGTTSVGTSSVVAELEPGQELCAPGERLPAGTEQIRLSGGTLEGRPTLTVTVRGPAGGRRGVIGAEDVRAQELVAPVGRISETSQGTVCVTAQGRGRAWIGGMQSLDDRPSPTLDGTPIGHRVSIWYLPAVGDRKSLAEQLPTIAERASLFRPGFVGPWTYWALFLAVLPGLGVAAMWLLARAVRDPAARGGPWLVALIAFLTFASFALITPAFHTPDESEHFAAAQYFAETGKAIDKTPGPRPAYSSEQGEFLNAIRHFSTIENREARPPWHPESEARWRAVTQGPDRPPSEANGGGNAIATQAHSPLYYATLAPAYLVTDGTDVPTELFAMRLTSGIYGALVALFAFLSVRELAPRRQWPAVTAGLIVAFQPMFGFMSGAVNNDMGLNAVAAAITYAFVRAFQRGLTVRLGLVLGALLALAPIMKGTGYAIYPVAIIAVLLLIWRARSWRTVGALVGALAAFALVVVVWGEIATALGRGVFTTPGGGVPTRGLYAIEDPLGYLRYVAHLFVPDIMGDERVYPQRIPAFSIYVVRGWASFGWYVIEFPKWVYLVIGIVLILGFLLGARTLWRERDAARARWMPLTVLALLPAAVFMAVEAAYATRGVRPLGLAEQGRYIFPALAALAALAALSTLGLGRRWAPVVASALIVALAGFNYLCHVLIVAGFYV